MKQRAINLLWVDDEAETLLAPLGRMLQEQGFLLHKATNYVDAVGLLDGNEIDSLLTDIILPHASGSSSLSHDLGLSLADRASTLSVRAITFLTVVPLSEVLDKYRELNRTYPDVRFQYLDKALLLEINTVELLSESLSPRSGTDTP